MSLRFINLKRWLPIYSSIYQFKSGKIKLYELLLHILTVLTLVIGLIFNRTQNYIAEVIFLCIAMSLSVDFMDEVTLNPWAKMVVFSIIGFLFSIIIMRRSDGFEGVIYILSSFLGMAYFSLRLYNIIIVKK